MSNIDYQTSGSETNLPELSSNWLAFLPQHTANTLLAHPERNPLEDYQVFETVALFADFSGFTALSEALARSGRQSAEELTGILNRYFKKLIEIIASYGGSIGKFGGDAVTVLFPLEIFDQKSQLINILRCAHQMQQHMAQYASLKTSAGVITLGMKIGIGRGQVLTTTVGIPPQLATTGLARLEYIIAGSVLDYAADAEHKAKIGDIILHESIIPSDLTVAPDENTAPPLELKQPVIPASLLPVLSSFLHPSLAQRLVQNQLDFFNEHRKVTILFANFSGFDYDNDPTVQLSLQSYFAEVITIIHRYDGYLNKIDMGDKGSKFIVLFGAPTAHEDDESRALKCALELMSCAYQYVSSFKIGINTGFVYCGLVGSDIRREYTVIGAAVNMAARMMQAAVPGQILVSEYTHVRLRENFIFEDLGEITVKGREEPIGIFALNDVGESRTGSISAFSSERQYSLPMVGRQFELNRVISKMELVQQGTGQVVGIGGEAGMGKSRLNAEIILRGLEAGFDCFAGEALSYGANLPYHAWNSLLRAFFGVESGWKLDRQIRQLTTQLVQIDPNLVKRLPLLGQALNLPIPDSPLTTSMEPKLRKESLEDLLVQCIKAVAHTRPIFLVLEDCHWLDALSEELLVAIARNIGNTRVLILTLYRPQGQTLVSTTSGGTSPHRPFVLAQAGLSYFEELTLPDFSPEEARVLIGLKLNQLWGQGTVREGTAFDPFYQSITNRALGNPFYIDELVNYIKDQKLDPTDPHVLTRLELPGTLYSLILSRIDQLGETQKLTVKVASVIGRFFPATWVWGIAPELGTPDQVLSRLSLLSNIEFTVLNRPEPELEYLFKHVLTRDVAYESMSVAVRAVLHEQVGLLMERLYPEKADHYLDLLAYHYGQSNNIPKKIRYFALAAENARRAYANQAAISYYRALLPLLAEEELPDYLLGFGQVLELVSEWVEAETIYKRAHNLLESGSAIQTTLLKASVELALGELYIRQERYPEALPWLALARDGFDGDFSGRCLALFATGDAYRLQGEYSLAKEFYDKSMALTSQIEDVSTRLVAQGKIYKSTGTLFAMQRNLVECEQNLEAGLLLMRQLNHKPGMGAIINNLGTLMIISDQPDKAIPLLEEALTLHKELGDRWGRGATLNNLGMALAMKGELTTARTIIEESIATQRNLGSPSSVANGLSTLADIEIQLGNFTNAQTLLRETLEMQKELNQGRGIAYALEYYAGVCAALDQPEKALKLAGAAAALREALPAPLAPDEAETHQKRLKPAREKLGEEVAQTLELVGRSLNCSEAINLSLEEM